MSCQCACDVGLIAIRGLERYVMVEGHFQSDCKSTNLYDPAVLYYIEALARSNALAKISAHPNISAQIADASSKGFSFYWMRKFGPACFGNPWS